VTIALIEDALACAGVTERTLQICYRSHSSCVMQRQTGDLASAGELDRYLLGGD
jgi:hypothetical protein